jgi:hypothetical protein
MSIIDMVGMCLFVDVMTMCLFKHDGNASIADVVARYIVNVWLSVYYRCAG